MHKPNSLLEIDVQDSLDWDAAIDDRRIAVNADSGRVTLTGSVPTYYEKIRAGEDAWSVGGVKSLENELLVGLTGSAVTDLRVEEACRVALDHDRIVPKGSVTPKVTNGVVQLRGQVRNPFQRDAAEVAVSRVDGLIDIENLLSISPEPIPSDVAERINKALERSAIVDGSKISVTNDGHTIYLTGVVGSRAAMREAVNTASFAPGVYAVVNNLTIES
jgi:osmotically-inducible protein OsmY